MYRIPLRILVAILILGTGACSYGGALARRCCPCPCLQRTGPTIGPEQPGQLAELKPAVDDEAATAPGETPTPAPAPRLVPTGRFTLAAAGLRAPTPAGWKFEQNRDTVVYQARARVPSIVFFRAEGATQAAAVERLPRQMGAEMRSVRVNRRRSQTTVAGYPALMLEGTGRIEIFPVRWRAYIIEARQRVVMAAVAPTFFWNAQQARIRSFIASMRAPGSANASVAR